MFGVDVVAGAHKAVSQKCMLEKLCRALQDENRSLKASCPQEQQVEERSEATAEDGKESGVHVDVQSNILETTEQC